MESVVVDQLKHGATLKRSATRKRAWSGTGGESHTNGHYMAGVREYGHESRHKLHQLNPPVEAA